MSLTPEQRIKKIIGELLDRDPTSLQATDGLVADLDADSLDEVEIVMALEDEFDITVSDALADDWKTVGDYVAGVQRLLGEAVTA